MKRYDPLKAPDPKAWLALGEQERIDLVQDYHRREQITLPNETAHAVVHAVVENQIALGDELPIERALHRLMAEGLDRHDAIHAIGSKVANVFHDILKNARSDADPNLAYCASVEQLTAEDWRRFVEEPTAEAETETTRLLDDLNVLEGLPVEAIRTADAHREYVAPIFLDVIEAYLLEDARPSIEQALFFIFHMLGHWREKPAYRPLAKLLSRPADEIDVIFGGATTETPHRVMAAVFDGDPQPLYDVILNREADEFVRSRMCEALAMVTLRGEMPRAEAERFLRACYSDLEAEDSGCFVWNGWQSAIAALGLIELKPLVQQAFEREYIDPSILNFQHFERHLQRALETPASPWDNADEFALFGDTIEELSSWYAFRPEYLNREKGEAVARAKPWSPQVPAVNPHKGVGRNDPCPCGSRKKFKKCCLN
jgi:hypothetical protein